MNAASPSTAARPAQGLGARNLLRLANLLRMRPLETFAALRDAGPVVRYRLGGRILYVVNDAELVYEMLVKHGYTIIRGSQFEKLRPLMGDGLLTTDNETHRRNRPIVNPAFHRDKLNKYVAVMAEETERRVAGWHDGQLLDLQTEARKNALTVAARCLSMTEMADRVASDVESHFPRFLDGLNPRAMLPGWMGDHLPGNKRFVESVGHIRETLTELVAHHEKIIADESGRTEDLVTSMLTASNPETGETLSAAQVSDEVVTLFVAATDTTSNTSAFAWRVLGEDPELAERVRAEADAAFIGDGPADLETVARLDLTRRVVKEVLRKYTPPWLVTRKVVIDTELGGYMLSGGAEVVFSPWAIHRNPAVFPDPERFDPDRWLPERAKSVPRHSWLPFGAGRRKCIGEAFAELEVTMTIAVAARHWRLEPTARRPVRPVPSATLRPDDAHAIVRSR